MTRAFPERRNVGQLAQGAPLSAFLPGLHRWAQPCVATYSDGRTCRGFIEREKLPNSSASVHGWRIVHSIFLDSASGEWFYASFFDVAKSREFHFAFYCYYLLSDVPRVKFVKSSALKSYSPNILSFLRVVIQFQKDACCTSLYAYLRVVSIF